MATDIQLESIKKALSYDRPMFCSGAVSPSPIYHSCRFIGFATPEQLDQPAARDPATFDHGNQDARLILSQNPEDGCHGFCSPPDRDLEEILLQGRTEKMSAKPEIYKAVSFKAHKDTPRDTGMLESLAIVCSTPHEGEELVLCRKDREWTFDANTLTSLQSSYFLAYVAFHGVIEQEVLKVTSGSLTPNLRSVHHGSISQAPASDPFRCRGKCFGL
ncbi:hypothetical protein BDM02DRAFT_3255005 [Thelephora ganbajun]|uniref:Uncharacterized protein n=1 Tax=Thelephora ganbajun TaxID=370292 RepID=A0ACB6YXB2_THEGA|nr:hypothetical protein BDM02DRAFT_3255005 [Thelephora ganbajun]